MNTRRYAEPKVFFTLEDLRSNSSTEFNEFNPLKPTGAIWVLL